MAMVVLGPNVTNIDGKVGGTIFRSDQCGPHAQAYPRLIKKRTWSQDQIRKGFADLHYIFFRRMTWELRTLWRDYARAHPVKNKKGYTTTLQGWPMYFKFNQPNWLKGIPPVWIPPGYKLPPKYQYLHTEWELQWFLLWGAQ